MRKLTALCVFVIGLSLLSPRAHAYNTAGSMLHVDSTAFSHDGLVQLTWTGEISEYDYVDSPDDPFRIRIEFNNVGFQGPAGICYVGDMIQNVGHTFPDDYEGSVTAFPALGLYITSLQSTWPDSFHGVNLNADPSVPPEFGRVFENVDGLGFSAKNIYTRQNVGQPTPDQPITVQWTVTKGDTVVNPQGNFSKDPNGNWAPLIGTFVKWNFAITINGMPYNVADYYLPQDYASNILATDPLVLHQEYFGAAEGILDGEKGTVRYTDLRAFDGSTWFPLKNWVLTFRIDDGAGNKDNRFGWKSDGVSLTSSVGHDTDVADCSRDPGATFTVVSKPPPPPPPNITNATYDGKKTVTIDGTNFGGGPAVLINNSNRNGFILTESDTEITLKAKQKKLGLHKGVNSVQVIGEGGAASNTFQITI